MKTVSRLALGLALAIGLAGGAATAPAFAKKEKKEEAGAARKYNFSKPAQKLLAEAQTAQQAGDNDTALAKLNEAEAIAVTPDDKFFVSQLRTNVGITKSDNALIEKGLEGLVSSGQLSAADKLRYQNNLVALALQRNDQTRATQLYEQMSAENPNDGEIAVGLGEMLYRSGRSAEAVKTIRKAIDLKRASGAIVPETWYKRALALAYDGKIAGEVTPASLMLVSAYPSPVNWRDSLVIFRDGAGFDDQGNLDIMRLMHDTKALTGERDYFEYAETANTRGLPGEAKLALDEGIAKGLLSPGKIYVKELVSLVTPKVNGDRASLPSLEKESRAAAGGKLSKATADGYLGYGENQKAADLYRLALQKGGVDAAEVNTRLGIALVRSGDKAGAEAALNAVTGKRADIAKFWLAHLNQAAVPAAESVPPTQG